MIRSMWNAGLAGFGLWIAADVLWQWHLGAPEAHITHLFVCLVLVNQGYLAIKKVSE